MPDRGNIQTAALPKPIVSDGESGHPVHAEREIEGLA
jgi:hypothetical protein